MANAGGSFFPRTALWSDSQNVDLTILRFDDSRFNELGVYVVSIQDRMPIPELARGFC